MNTIIRFISTRPLHKALAVAMLLSVQAQAQEKITLQQAIQNTLDNNLQIKQVALSEALSQEAIQQSKYALLPNLNASANQNFSFGRSEDPTTRQFVNNSIANSNGSLSSNVALFQGFQKINQIAQNKYQLEADKSNTQKMKNDLTLLVVSTYLQVLNNADLVLAAQQQLDITRQQLDRVQKLFNVGNNTTADLSLAKSQVASSELNLTNNQNQLDISYLNLAQLMERDPASKFEVVAPAINEIGNIYRGTPEEVFAKATENYPDVRLSNYNLLAAQKGVDIARGNYMPRLSLGASLGSGYSNNRFGSTVVASGLRQIGVTQTTNEPVVTQAFTSTTYDIPFFDQVNQNFNQGFGFSLSIPIFNGFSARSSVRRAKISVQNAELSQQLTKNNLNKTINQAVLDLRAAEKSYASAQSAYNSQLDAFKATQQRYTVGLVNSLEFNQAQTNLNTAQFNMIQAKYNLIFRNKVIDYYLGNPISF
jgi:outer membrane protein